VKNAARNVWGGREKKRTKKKKKVAEGENHRGAMAKNDALHTGEKGEIARGTLRRGPPGLPFPKRMSTGESEHKTK